MKLIKNARMLMENGSFAQSMDILFDKKIIRTAASWRRSTRARNARLWTRRTGTLLPALLTRTAI